MLFLKNKEILKPEHYFDLSGFAHKDIFNDVTVVWEILVAIETNKINLYAEKWIEDFKKNNQFWQSHTILGHQNIIKGPGTKILHPSYIEGPVIIGANCLIGPFAHLKDGVIIGDNCVIGNYSEVKHSIFLNGARAPHHNYVGDSVVGNNVNLGSGVKLANYKLGGGEISVKINDLPLALREKYENLTHICKTGLDKFGAIIGDGTEIGCNSVVAPGTLIGKNVWIYSLANPDGYIPSNTIVKPQTPQFTIIEKKE